MDPGGGGYNIYIYIQWLTPTPPPRYQKQSSRGGTRGGHFGGGRSARGASKSVVAVAIVARILGGVFDPKTSVLGSPGVVLATLGSIVVTLASPRDPKGSPMSEREVLGRFRALHLGTHFGTFSHKS